MIARIFGGFGPESDIDCPERERERVVARALGIEEGLEIVRQLFVTHRGAAREAATLPPDTRC